MTFSSLPLPDPLPMRPGVRIRVSIMTIYKLLGTEARPRLLGTNSCAPDSIYAIRTEMGWTDSFDIAGFINMLTSIQKKSYPQNDALHIFSSTHRNF